MLPPDNSLDDVVSLDDSSLEGPVQVQSGFDAGQKPSRLSVMRFNSLAFALTGAALAVIVLIGVGGLILSNAHDKKLANANRPVAANYAVSNLPLDGLTANKQLQVGKADHLAVNGQLRVSNSLVLSPSGVPTSPTAGQIYYDKVTNAPYYYNGSQFISLAPTAVPQSVTSIGGVSGAISVGNGLQVTGGQLALTNAVTQALTANGGVKSLQGQAGDVTLTGGNGIAINGTTIRNTGVASLASGSASVVVSQDGNGNYTLSSSAVVGSGSVNQIALFTGGSTLGGSILSQSGSSIINSGSLTVTGAISTNNIAQTAAGQNVSISAGNDVLTFTAGGRTFTFPTSGAASQTICTTGISCASGGGAAVVLQPGAAQLDTGSGSSIFVNNTGGGNLLQLQGAGSDRFVVSNGGDTTISGNLVAQGGTLTTGTGSQQGSLVLSAGNGNSGTLRAVATLGQNTTFTLPDPGAATATICLSTGNCSSGGAAGGDLTGTYPNPTLAKIQGTAVNISGLSSGQILQYNGASFVNQTISGDITLSNTGVATIGAGKVTNTNLVNSSLTVTAGAGLSGGGTVALGGTTSLTVQYGSSAGTAVQGNTTLTCASGIGNLSGGGNSITLGTGGSCSNISITNSPTFSGTLSVTGAGGVAIGVSGTTNGNLVLANSGNAHFTTIQGIAPAGQDQVITVPSSGAASDTVCLLTLANCAGAGGGITGVGTTNFITKYTGSGATIGNSQLFDNGTSVGIATATPGASYKLDVNGNANVNGGLTIANGVTVTAGGANITGSITLNGNTSVSGVNTFSVGTGATTLGGTLGVTGLSTLSGGVTITGVSSITGTTNINTSGTANTTIGNASGNFAVTSTGLNVTAVGDVTGGTFNTATISGGTVSGGSLSTTSVNGLSVAAGVITSPTIAGTLTLSSLNTAGVLHTDGSGVVSTGVVVLGTETSGNYVSSLGSVVGLTIGGTNGVAGAVPTLSVNYGSGANTAVQGNTSLTCASGTGNLSGGGNSVTLGAGGSCNNLTITNSPSFSGTLSVTGAGGTTIGVAGTTAGVLNLANGTNTNISSLQAAAPGGTGTAAYTLPSIAGGTGDTVCLLTLANCAGTGGGITGSGTNGKIARFSSSNNIVDSTLTESGSTVTASGNVVIQGANGLTIGTAGPAGNTGSIAFKNSTNANVTTLQSGVPASNFSLTLPTTGGANGDCLQSQGGGVLVFTSCTGGTGGGVTSLDAQTGILTLANSSGAAGTITIDDASTTVKGIAQFNATNFSDNGSGTINTIQDIDSTSTPTFGALTLNGALTVTAGGFAVTGNSTITGTLNTATISGGSVSGGSLTATAVNGLNVSGSAIDTTGASALSIGATNATLTVGNTGKLLTLQGNASSVITATGGGFTTTVGFSGSPTASQTYNFDRTAPAGTYTICTTVGNCVGTGGAVSTTGGTQNYITKYNNGGATQITNSQLFDNGTNVGLNVAAGFGTVARFTINGNITADNAATSQINTGAAGNKGLVIQGFGTGVTPNQTADLLQFQDSTGTVLAKIDSSGNLTAGTLNGATITSTTFNTANISGGTLSAGTFSGGSVSGGSVTGGSLTATAVNGLNVSGTAISGTGALTVNANGSNTISIGGISTGDILLGGGSGGSGCTVTNSNGNLLCDGTINGATISGGAFSGGSVSAGTFSGGSVSGGSLTATAVNGLNVSSSAIDTTGASALSIGAANATLTIGNTGKLLTLQGNASSVFTATGGGFTTTVGFSGSPTASQTYNFDRTAAAGTYTVCTTANNCVGTGGSVSTTGGTQNFVTKYSNGGATQISNSQIFDNGTNVNIGSVLGTGGLFNVGASNQFQVAANGNILGGTFNTAVISGGTLSGTAVNSLNVSGTAISGTGALTVDANGSNTISIGGVSTGDVLLGGGVGATGCTVTNSNGNLACAGTLTASGGFVFPGDGVLQVNSSKDVGSKTGIIIPMYIYPASVYTNADYNNVIALKKKYHDVPVTVILNPSSGPGGAADGNFTAAIDRLHGAGITVIGYIATGYTAQPLASAEADVDTWVSFYPAIDGIFTDEMANGGTAPELAYYTALTNYIHGKGLYPSIANPGAGVPNSYFTNKTADTIMIYENSPYASETDLKGDYAGGYADINYKQRAGIVYGVNDEEDNISLLKQYLGAIYVTDDTLPNPFDSLPPYLENIFRQLDIDTDRLYGDITVSKSLGVGTSSATGLLQVVQATNGRGTVTTNGSTTLTGSSTQFLNTLRVGDTINVSGETARTITAIASDTSLTVSVAFSTTASGLSYTVTGGDRLTVLGNGNVGIGVSSGFGNAARLTVNANSTTDNAAAIQFNTGTAGNKGLVIQGAASQSSDLLQLQDNSGNINAAFSSFGNQLTLGRIAASGTVTQGKLVLGDGTTDNFGLTLQSATLTGSSKTYTFPNSSASTDTVCLLTLANCAGAGSGVTASGGATNFITKFSGATTVTSSQLFDDGTHVSVGNSLGTGGLFNVGSSNQFQVGSGGAVTAVGVDSGTGLIQGTGGLTIQGVSTLYASGSTNVSIGGTTNWLRSPKNTVTAFIGDNDSTAAYAANDVSGNIRFNGSGVAWGDFGYYPTGGDAGEQGNFRLAASGNAISSTPSGKLGIGELYSVGNVGIGTTTSLDLLHVASPTEAALRLQDTSGSGGTSRLSQIGQTLSLHTYDQTGAFTGTILAVDGANQRIGLGATPANSLLTVGTNTTTAAGGITFGTDTNLYRSGANALKTDDSFTAVGLLQGNAGLTATGAAVNLNASSNFATNINTGTSTGAVAIGNSASSGFTLESGTSSTSLFNGATAHTIQLATGAAAQSVTIGSTDSTSSTSIQGGASGFIGIGSILSSTLSSTTVIGTSNNATGTQVVNIGSSANALNSVTLSAGSTNGIHLNSAVVDSTSNTIALFATPTTSVSLGSGTATLNLGPGGATATSVNLAGGSGATGCTVDGATGNLTCSGSIAGGSGSSVGYFTRSGVTIQPATAGDNITTSGNLSTSGSGAITAAGVLNANATGASAITIADSGAQNSGLTIGGDTNLYRFASNALKTDGSLYAGNHVVAQTGNVYLQSNAGQILLGASSDTNLYRAAANSLKTDSAFTAVGLLQGNAGLTATGAAVNLNASSNFATNINTGTSTGAVAIGNSASSGFTLESGTATAQLLNGATAHTIQIATGAAAQSVTIGSLNTTSQTTIQGGGSGINLIPSGLGSNTGITVQSATATDSLLKVRNFANNGNILVVDSLAGGVAINNNNAGPQASLDIGAGGLRLAGAYTSFVTPTGSTVSTYINIPYSDPGAFGQLLAFGISRCNVASEVSPTCAVSGYSDNSARGISVFDARVNGAHQPTIAVFNPEESDALGFSWDGTTGPAGANNLEGFVKSLGAPIGVRINTTDVVKFQANGSTQFNGNEIANNLATGTTGTTSGTGGTSVTAMTLAAAGSFANNDVIFVDNTGGSGQDYYTRIVSGAGTTSLVVSPAVSYGTAAGYTGNAAITKYNAQYIGSDGVNFAAGATRNANSFFQGYFSGGVVVGTGSTTLSDGNLTSTGQLTLSGTSVNLNNTSNSNTAFQIQSAGGAETLFSANTNTRTSGVAGNLLKVGNSTGTDTNLTILQLDSASADPTTNLASLNGGLFYNSSTNKVSIIENGVVKELCNKVDLLCGAGATTTLQNVYDAGATASITTTNARDLSVTLADTATDSNFVLNVATGSTSKFKIQNNSADVLAVGSAGQLALSAQGSTGGLLIGGDTNLYRSAANTLATDSIFNLAASTTSGGYISQSGSSLIHTYGTNDFFAGAAAGNFTLTGSGQNTGVGMNTLQDTTNASDNSAFGYNALANATTGGFNVGVGSSALLNTLGGFSNTAVGTDALKSNTSGDSNVAIGNLAGYTGTAGNANTVGDKNTFVGYSSGPGVSSASNLQNATAIGAYSVVNQDNSLVLGCTSGTNGCTANTRIGIGTTTPSALLHVSSGGTDPLFRVTDTTATAQDVFNIADGGATTLRNQSNSTAAFQVQNAAGVNVVRVDTSNQRVAIGDVAAPALKFEVQGGDAAVYNSGNNARIVLGDDGTSGQYGYLGWDSTNDYFRVETDGTNGLKVKGNNVSIGNIFPGSPLEVGIGSTSIFQLASTTGAATFKNASDSATAFQIQSASAAETLFTVNTTTRAGGTAGNTLKVGNSTGTDTALTVLQLDGVSADPTTNLASLNGGLFYNSGTNKVSIVENGVVKVLCNKTDLLCGSATNTNLQDAYNNSAGAAPSILTTGTNKAFTVQTTTGGTGISAGNELFGVRASNAGNTIGNSILTVNSTGLGINISGTGNPATTGDLTFGQGADRTINLITQATAATAGNNLTVSAATGNTSGAGGQLFLNGGTGGTSGAGGAVTLQGGTGGGSNVAGGAVNINGGTASGSGTGGLTTIRGGAAAATAGSVGGGVTVIAANGTSTSTGAAGGNVLITAGNAGGSAANNGGTITLQAGSATSTGTAGGVLVKNAADSTTAFQVQNAAGGNLFQIDSTNSNVTINGNNAGQVQAWQTGTNTGMVARDSQQTVYANGYIYLVGGGANGAIITTSDVQYAKVGADGNVGSWTTATSTFPGGVHRLGSSAVAVNGYLYIISGSTTNTFSTATTTVFYAKMNTDGSLGTWQTAATAVPQGLWYSTAVSANGYIYVMGGKSTSNVAQSTVYYAKVNADGSIGSFTTSSNTLSAAAWDHSSAVANGYAYVVGGNGSTTVQYAKLNTDGTTAAWATSTALPVTRSGSGIGIANGYLYTFGGSNAAATTFYGNTLYAALNSNGTIGSWNCQGSAGDCTGATQINTTALPVSVSDVGDEAVMVNGYMYVIGGADATSTKSTVYYTSAARIKIGGSVDLVGLGGETLTEGGTGGALTAGNTNIVGALQVQGDATFAQSLSVGGNLNVVGQGTLGQGLNLTGSINGQNYSVGTISQSTTTVTGSGTTFTAGMVGGLLFYPDGTSTTVTAFSSATSITVAASKTVSSGSSYNLQWGGLSVNGAGTSTLQSTTNSSTAFRIQNAGGTTLFNADTSGLEIKVSGISGSFATLTLDNAHFKSTQTTKPTIGTPSTCSTSPSATVANNSTDSAGSITITAGSGSNPLTPSCNTVVTFNKTYGAAPKSIIITAKNETAAGDSPYVSASSATTFTVSFGGGVNINDSMQIYYWVIE